MKAFRSVAYIQQASNPCCYALRSIYSGLDWAANLSHMMGYEAEGAKELMRLYQTIHSDHEARPGHIFTPLVLFSCPFS